MSTSQEKSASAFSKIPISESVNYLKIHLREITTVGDWADKMGYEDSKSFSDDFREEFRLRPQPVLLAFRARKIISLLWSTQLSNYEIALDFQLQDEKGLYQFVKTQTDYAPSNIKELSEQEYKKLLERLENNIIEQD